MSDNSKSPWTDERKAQLKTWWLEERRSSSDIVELFGRTGVYFTRNSIIGAVHRSDWWKGMTRVKYPPKPRKRKAAARPTRPPPRPKPKPVYQPPPPPPPPPRKPGEPLYLLVTEVGFGQCRFWYGESRGGVEVRKPKTGFCGHRTEKGLSWCPVHVELVYAKGARAVPTPWIEPRQAMPTGGFRTNIQKG